MNANGSGTVNDGKPIPTDLRWLAETSGVAKVRIE